MRSIRVNFPGGLDHELVGRLETPTTAPQAYAIYAACFTCVKDLKGARRISRRLVERGVGVLRFDYTGLGESRGEFEHTTFGSKVADIVAAARFLATQYEAPAILLGHSIGGAAVIAAAESIQSARFVATINAPSETRHLAELIERRAPTLAAGGAQAMSFAGGKPVPISHSLVRDLHSADVATAIRTLRIPLIVFQATADELLGQQHADAIFNLAPQPKSYVAIPGGDHLLIEREADANLVADVVAAHLWGAAAATAPRELGGDVRSP